MKQSTKKRVLSRVLVCSALLVLGSPVVGQAIISVPVAHAATNSNPVADQSTMRSITITKYQAKTANDHGDNGTGNFDSTVTNTPLQGVVFNLYKVTAIGDAALTDPTVQKEGTDYTKTLVGTGTTDANGQIEWSLGSPDGSQKPSSNVTGDLNSMPDGIYMVVEGDDSKATDPTTNTPVTVVNPTNPFFVQVPQTSRDTSNPGLIYDVNAQPKNVIANDLNPEKTIDGKQFDSLVAGNAFEWELDTNIPTGLYDLATKDTQIPIVDANGNQLYNADKSPAYFAVAKGDPMYFPGGNYFQADGTTAATAPASANYTVHDTLNKDLTYNAAKSSMGIVSSDGTYHQFDSSLYTLTAPDADGNFYATLTAAGIQAVGTGSVKLADGSTYTIVTGDKISTHINTAVEAGWDGVIPNTFDVTYQTPGSKPVTQTPPPSQTPGYADGGIEILKEAQDTKKPMAGAEFMIATSEANANANKFLASDGNSYVWANPSTSAQPQLPSGVTFLTSGQTGADGIANFKGLPLDLVSAGADNVVGTSDDTWSRDYYVVETKAPDGYELLKSPQKVTVTNTTAGGAVDYTYEDAPKTLLPFTGGRGTTAMVTFALVAIAGGTAIVVVDKKRKGNKTV